MAKKLITLISKYLYKNRMKQMYHQLQFKFYCHLRGVISAKLQTRTATTMSLFNIPLTI